MNRDAGYIDLFPSRWSQDIPFQLARIDNLHSQSLNNTEDAVSQRSAALLAELEEETSALSVLSATLKRRIQALERQPSRERDGRVRIQQVRRRKSGRLRGSQAMTLTVGFRPRLHSSNPDSWI